MANLKISQLTSAATLTGAEVVPIVQGTSTVKTTVQDIANLAGLGGTNYVFVTGNGTPVQNGVELLAAYDTAKTMSPSASNIISVVVAPGDYSTNGALTLDTSYINIVSLTGNRDVILGRSDIVDPIQLSGYDITNVYYCLSVEADYVHVKGIVGKELSSPNWNYWMGVTNPFRMPIDIAGSLPNIIIENCFGGNFSFGADYTYGSAPGKIIQGTFKDVDAKGISFGTYAIVAGGTYINCNGVVEYPATDILGDWFGASGTASGTFIDCNAAGTNSFAGGSGTCVASGTFINCSGDNSCFGKTSSGVFENCKAKNYSFGNTTASGTFTSCVGTIGGFGGSLTGKLFFCRLTAGLFPTVTGAGRTYYCIDGSGNTNNQ